MPKCRICGQQLRAPDGAAHHLELVMDGACLGCFMFSVEMQKFLIRATDMGMTPMGDWTTGWMREIIKDPKRYL